MERTELLSRRVDGDTLSRRRLLRAAAAGALGSSVMGLPKQVFAEYRTVAAVSQTGVVAELPAQTMQGFGASGAWWTIDFGHFRRDVQERAGELLFSTEIGIGLSAYRYNIGGGSVGVTNLHRAPETFLVSPGQYDWNRDPSGRQFLGLAARHQIPVLVGFVNSPPATWTTNGLCTGGALKSGTELDYAAYLADIAAHFHDQGIRLTHISPMNEPDYTFAGGGQEGCAVPVSQRATLVSAVAKALAAKAPTAQVVADESSRVSDQFLPEAPQWLGQVDHQMAAVAHHMYDFPSNATLQVVRQVSAQSGLPTWMTEICCQSTSTGTFGQGYDPTIANALLMADLIWLSLTQANDAAFHWWVAASSAIGDDPVANPQAPGQANPNGWNDGLIYYDPNFAANGNQNIYLTKRFWVMGNFSRYVRPGAQRHDVTGVADPLRVMAFSTGRHWTVIAINHSPAGSAPVTLRLQIPGTGFLLPLEAVQTSASSDLERVLPPMILPKRQIQASLPAQSVTTYVVDGQPGG